ncbi:MAG: 4Fe-4S binding protein [Candidatus Lokiarchaeota archaeon]|nr:4Fe-4S binding protein [Candidatus Lokiarchaeota archaeon]
MELIELELKAAFQEMVENAEKLLRNNENTRRDLKDFKLSVQWNVGSLNGYQIFNKGEYLYKIDEELDKPNLLITFESTEIAKKLFEGKLRDFRQMKDGLIHRFRFVENEDNMNIIEPKVPFEDFEYDMQLKFSKKRYDLPLMFLAKIPVFNTLYLNHWDAEHVSGGPIPINQSLGTYENQIIPLVVLEHFLKKAKFIYLVDCGCRIARKCENHDYRLGCMYLGQPAANIDLTAPWRIEKHGHYATFEDAMDQARRAIEDGLVPTLGRLRGDVIALGILPDDGHLMSICFCCSCCCAFNSLKYATSDLRNLFTRMEGVKVEIDIDMCSGCGTCVNNCMYGAVKIIDGKAQINQDFCLGCGRCETNCPDGAVSISIENVNKVEELIARLESYIDVS